LPVIGALKVPNCGPIRQCSSILAVGTALNPALARPWRGRKYNGPAPRNLASPGRDSGTPGALAIHNCRFHPSIEIMRCRLMFRASGRPEFYNMYILQIVIKNLPTQNSARPPARARGCSCQIGVGELIYP
jgi:hypothetical protein